MKKKYLIRFVIVIILGFLLGRILWTYVPGNIHLFIYINSTFFFLFALLLLVHVLDQWSTKILFAVNWLYLHNKELREREVERDLEEGIEKWELNPFPRLFIKKFGVMKGLKITTYFISLPIFATLGLYALYVYPGDPATYISYLLVFYIGAMYVQILRAKARKERIEKLGYDIDELIKGDMVK